MKSLGPIVIALTLAAPAVAAESREIVSALHDSLGYLEDEGSRWMEGKVSVQEGQRCVSCHHVGFAVWAHREAERAGIDLPAGPIDDLARRARTFLAQPDRARVVSASQMILAGEHGEHDLDVIRGSSKQAGQWRARGQFPTQRRGEQESDAVMSLWAIAALGTLDPIDAETAARRDRALHWLDGAEPGSSNEWTAARLVVAAQRSETKRIAALVDELLTRQHPDGGWGWLTADDPSDPFSTGVALYALATASDARARDAIERGVDFLLERQRDDGTWETPSTLTSVEPTAGKDTIYRFWGTAWASLGLARVRATRHEAGE